MIKMTDNIFENASRLGTTVETAKGVLDVTALWQLPLTSKNGISINSVGTKVMGDLQRMESSQSFVNTNSSDRSEVKELKNLLAILEHIRDVRQEENALRLGAIEKSNKASKIRQAIADAESRELGNKSVDELKKELEELT